MTNAPVSLMAPLASCDKKHATAIWKSLQLILWQAPLYIYDYTTE